MASQVAPLLQCLFLPSLRPQPHSMPCTLLLSLMQLRIAASPTAYRADIHKPIIGPHQVAQRHTAEVPPQAPEHTILMFTKTCSPSIFQWRGRAVPVGLGRPLFLH